MISSPTSPAAAPAARPRSATCATASRTPPPSPSPTAPSSSPAVSAAHRTIARPTKAPPAAEIKLGIDVHAIPMDMASKLGITGGVQVKSGAVQAPLPTISPFPSASSSPPSTASTLPTCQLHAPPSTASNPATTWSSSSAIHATRQPVTPMWEEPFHSIETTAAFRP